MNPVKIVQGLALTAFVIGAVYVFFVATARADEQPVPQCGPFNEISARLEKAHEVQISGGIIDETHVLIIFAEPKGDTWTSLVVNSGNGIACMLGMGQDWFQLPILSGEPI